MTELELHNAPSDEMDEEMDSGMHVVTGDEEVDDESAPAPAGDDDEETDEDEDEDDDDEEDKDDAADEEDKPKDGLQELEELAESVDEEPLDMGVNSDADEI